MPETAKQGSCLGGINAALFAAFMLTNIPDFARAIPPDSYGLPVKISVFF